MQGSNGNGPSNDILDQALDELVKDESLKHEQAKQVDSDDDWIGAIFEEDSTPGKTDNESTPSPSSDSNADSEESEALAAAPSTPLTQKMDQVEQDIADGLDKALGDPLSDDATPAPEEEPVTLLDDELFAEDGSVDAMLDDTGEILPVEDSGENDNTDSEDSELDEMFEHQPSESDDEQEQSDTGASEEEEGVAEKSDEELDALLDEPSLPVDDGVSDEEAESSVEDIVVSDPVEIAPAESVDGDIDALLDDPDLHDDLSESATSSDEEIDDDFEAMLGDKDNADDDSEINAVTGDSETEEEISSDDDFEAMLDDPDLTVQEEDDVDEDLDTAIEDTEPADGEEEGSDDFEAMLGETDLTEEQNGEEEGIDDDIDSMLGDDATEDGEEQVEDDDFESLLDTPDLTEEGSEEEITEDVSDLLGDFGDNESEEAEEFTSQEEDLDLDSLSGFDSPVEEKVESQEPSLRDTTEYERMLDSASEADTDITASVGVGEEKAKSFSEKRESEVDVKRIDDTDEDMDDDMKKGKSSLAVLIVATLLSGAAGLAGGIFGPGLLGKAGITLPNADVSQEVYTTVYNLRGEVERLESELVAVTNENSNAIVRLRGDVDTVKASQKSMEGQQAEFAGKVGELEKGMGQFEVELVKRVEALLTLVENATENNRTMSSDIKETVLREVVQLIEDGGVNGMSAKMQKALEEFKDRADDVSQLQEMVQGLRNLTTMTNAEMKYLTSRVGKLEQKPTNNYFDTQATQKPKKEKPSPLNNPKPVNVYVDTEQQVQSAQAVRERNTNREEKINRPPKQFVVGIHEARKGDYTIYLQAEGASGTQFKTYRFAGTESSVVPGYGRITGVSKVNDPSTMVDYVVSTESGLITGKKRQGIN